MPASSPPSPAAAELPAPRPAGRWRALLPPALALAAGLALGARSFRPATENPEATARGYLRYKEILTYVDHDYVDSVDAEGLTDYAVTQLLVHLDPHSVYIAPRDRAQTDAFLQSTFDGVGVELNSFRDTTTVVATLPGSPAETAGLRPGDQLLRVGEVPVAGVQIGPSQLSRLLQGERGTTLSLAVARPHQPGLPLRVQLVREKLPNSSVEPAVLLEDGQTGYLRIDRFATDTYDEFKAQLADLQRQGLRRLVLDLRGNPGGYLDRATRLADEFVGGSRKLVYTVGKDEQYTTQTYAQVAGEWEKGPLVVLIDENSASAAEVLAGALQDHDRALLVGRRSFGKGLVQQPITLQGGGELRLTVARYYTPSGRCIQKPYGPDKATYNQELTERARHGELASADSVRATGPRFRTDHGRVVYGGGGIVPDVFVPRDTLANSAYFNRLQQRGVLRAFALHFYQQHKVELTNLRFQQYQAVFRITDTELDGVGRLATLAGLRPDATALYRCAPAVRTTLKAYIARSAYGPEAARAIFRADDPALQQALHVVQDSTAQLALLGR